MLGYKQTTSRSHDLITTQVFYKLINVQVVKTVRIVCN